MSKPILNYDEQAARIRVLERALVASDLAEAWQKYCEGMMPQRTAYVYPLAGTMYTTFVAGWNAAKENK